MPRTARATPGGFFYHVLNRGNARRTVFHKDADYAAFRRLLREAQDRTPVRLLAYCLMPNHFHLAVRPAGNTDLSRFMQWLLTAHVRRYHRHYHSTGHVWQGRFKAFPVQDDDYLLGLLRYVERNPVRAGLVGRSEEWRWSSAHPVRAGGPVLDLTGMRRPADSLAYVNQPQTEAEVVAMRECLSRGRPYGAETWAVETAARLGLESSLRPVGRPRKAAAERSLFDQVGADVTAGAEK
jgi:putative transposase